LAAILQLVRDLRGSAFEEGKVLDLALRHYESSTDVNKWLTLHRACFPAGAFRPRSWTPADFRREFLAKSWWRPERMWLAELPEETPELVGAVALGLRGRNEAAVPSVQWLMVRPEFRRRGVATALMWRLESAALAAGHTSLHLETRSDWAAAVAFYRRLGFRSK